MTRWVRDSLECKVQAAAAGELDIEDPLDRWRIGLGGTGVPSGEAGGRVPAPATAAAEEQWSCATLPPSTLAGGEAPPSPRVWRLERCLRMWCCACSRYLRQSETRLRVRVVGVSAGTPSTSDIASRGSGDRLQACARSGKSAAGGKLRAKSTSRNLNLKLFYCSLHKESRNFSVSFFFPCRSVEGRQYIPVPLLSFRYFSIFVRKSTGVRLKGLF